MAFRCYVYRHFVQLKLRLMNRNNNINNEINLWNKKQKQLRTTWIANGLDNSISICWYCMAVVVRLIRNYNTVTLIISGLNCLIYARKHRNHTHFYSFFVRAFLYFFPFVCVDTYMIAKVHKVSHTFVHIPTFQFHGHQAFKRMLVDYSCWSNQTENNIFSRLLPSVWMKSAQNFKLNMHKNRTK